MKTVRLPGRKWVTCSAGWIVSAALLILFGGSIFLFFMVVILIDGPDAAAILIGVGIGGFFCSIPWFTRAAVTVTSTHLRRAPQLGRPVKVPLTELTHLWPTENGNVIGSPAGNLIDLSPSAFTLSDKGFYDFGPKLAKLIDAEWLPMEPIDQQTP